jgi:hypothetical protein
MLNNVVFILRPADRRGFWVFLPLCNLMLVFFLFCCTLHYCQWVCHVTVFVVVLRYRPFVVVVAVVGVILLLPLGLTLLCRVLFPWLLAGSDKCKIVFIPEDGRKAETCSKIIVYGYLYK